MSRRAALLAALGCLAILGVAGSPDFEADAEDLFLSFFTGEPGQDASARARRLAGYGTDGNGGYGDYGGYGDGAYGSGGYGGPSPSPSPKVPSPSPSPEASPSPSPSPDPSPLCQGVAYDGYLTSCTVWADTNGDGIQAASEPSAAITAGQFAFAEGAIPTDLGMLHVSTADEASSTVASGSAVCHDATTLLAVHFPYAAPHPASCSTKLVISPLTTLLTYTGKLSTAALLEALNLPTTFELLTKDSLAAAIASDSDANRVYRREVQLQQLVLVGANMLTSSSTYLPSARKAVLQSLADTAAPTAGARRLMTGTMDFTSSALVLEVLELANQLAEEAIPSADLITLNSATLQAIANAIAAMNSIIETSTSIDAVQRAALISQTVLASQVAQLAKGEISVDAFQAATSTDALLAAIQNTTVPGTPPTDGNPSSSPSPSPSSPPTDGNPSSSPSPSPSSPPTDDNPSASPSPSPSPSPDNQQDTSLPLCQGVAYDGYLTSCTVWADANGDGIQGASEPSATITAGQFAFANGTIPSGLGVLRVNTADEASKTVASGSAVCHDATSLLAVHFPYAAPHPASCSAKLVISPLTTLLAYTGKLSTAALLEALNLPTTYELLTKDSLAASAAGDSDAKRVYRRETQLQQLVLVGSRLLTSNSAYLPIARKAILQSLASSVAPAAGRRLLADAAVQSLDFSSGALVQQLITVANQVAAASIPSAELTTLSSAVLEAVANSVAAMNSLIETSTSVETIAKASVASQTVLSDSIAKLAAGEISLTTFQTATSVSALQDAVQQATLPGAPLPSTTTAATEKKSSRAVALGVGLGIGLGVPALAGAAAAAYYLWWKPAHAASGLTRPML